VRFNVSFLAAVVLLTGLLPARVRPRMVPTDDPEVLAAGRSECWRFRDRGALG
jgi:hypothetical protein